LKEHPKFAEIVFEIDLLDLHVSNPQRYPFLLESAACETPLGRYDILFAFPQSSLKLDNRFRLHGPQESPQPDFLSAFDTWWAQLREPADVKSRLPFRGGWFVFLGYELAQEVEPSLSLETNPGLPVALAVRIPVAVIRDRHQSAAWIIGEAGCESLVEEVRRDIMNLQSIDSVRNSVLANGSLREDAPERFLAAVEAAKDYIAAGDILQANLSRQWTGLLAPDTGPADLYRNLRQTSPAPFAGLALLDGISLICSSPERLLRCHAGRVETRPIAGTRPRSAAPGNDEQQRRRWTNSWSLKVILTCTTLFRTLPADYATQRHRARRSGRFFPVAALPVVRRYAVWKLSGNWRVGRAAPTRAQWAISTAMVAGT
jgi:anthranilate synthase component 1